jgi:hypothetical protein
MEECLDKFMLFFLGASVKNCAICEPLLFLTDSTDCTDYNLCLQGPPTA